MDKSLLVQLNIEDKITNLRIFETGIEIELEFGNNIKINDYHDQECCEKVYADWSILHYEIKNIINRKYNKLIIKSVEDMGFILYFEAIQDNPKSFNYGVKILIPCYNKQYGYYSDELHLIINNKTIDITNCSLNIEP